EAVAVDAQLSAACRTVLHICPLRWRRSHRALRRYSHSDRFARVRRRRCSYSNRSGCRIESQPPRPRSSSPRHARCLHLARLGLLWQLPTSASTSSTGSRQEKSQGESRTQLGPQSEEFFVVPQAGLEPARSCEQQILSLPRLPIPPLGLSRRNMG